MSEAQPIKALGQHWLNDELALSGIADAADIANDETVLEIGPGPGALTAYLLERAGQVIAVEFDTQLATALPSKFRGSKLEVVNQDILSFDFTTIAAPYKVVANIPYYLTSKLIRVLSETPNPPLLAVLLIQKEVAERVAAAPGAMSLLSVGTQFYWEVSLGEVVPAEAFTPEPKVDSQVLLLKYRSAVLFPDVDERRFFRLVKVGFAQRRKTLLNSLASGLHLEKPEIEYLCRTAGIDPNRRAQTLSLYEWHELYTEWQKSSS